MLIANNDLTPSLADHTITSSTTVGGSSTRTFTIQNNGDGPLTISSITVSAAPFSLVSPLLFPVVVPPSGTQNLVVGFNPTAHGTPTTPTTNVTISSDDPSNPTYTFEMYGNTAAEAKCKNFTAYLDGFGNATVFPADVNDNSIDNSGISTFTVNGNPSVTFTCAQTNTTQNVTLGIVANDGDIDNCVALVTVLDAINPIFTSVASNKSDNTDASVCTYTKSGTDWDPTFTDNCPGSTIAYTSSGAGVSPSTGSSLSGAVFQKGTTTITWVVTDASGNTNLTAYSYNISDNEQPTFNFLPSDQSVPTDAGVCTYTHTNTFWDATASDNCGSVTLTADLTGATIATGLTTLNGVTFNKGVTTVTWIASDGSTPSITYSFLVKVSDLESPVISGMPATISVNAVVNNCGQTVFWTPPTQTDNCPGSTMTSNYNSGTFFPVGVTYVVYTATDLSGNVTKDSFKIEVIDNQKPKIQNVPANITVFNDAGFCGANVTWLPPTVSDNCPGVTTSATHLPGSYFPVGTTTVTYTATAANGDTTVKSFTVTVNDNEKPNVSVLNPTVYLDAFGNATISVSTVEASSSDNCGIATKTININTFNCSNIGVNPVVLTVTDIYGNVENQTSFVTIADNLPPTFGFTPGNQFVNTNPVVCTYTHINTFWDATASDNCIVTLTADLTGATTATGLTTLNGVTFNKGVTTVTWTASDGTNTSTHSFTVTVTDNEAPVFSVTPGNQPVNTNFGVCTYTHTNTFWDAMASDNCGSVTLTADLAGATTATGLTTLNGVTFNNGATTVTWTANDGTNTSTHIFTVTVTDNEAPVFSVTPGNQSVNTNFGVCTYTHTNTFWDATASDNCGSATLTADLAGATTATGLTTLNGVTFNNGTTTVTWTASDGTNTSTHSFTVTITDNEAPVFSITPGNQFEATDPSQCTYTHTNTFWDATASDNCGSIILTANLSGATLATGLTSLNGVAFNTGVTIVTWIANDGINTSTHSFTVTVTDNQTPTFGTTPGNQSFDTDLGLCSYTHTSSSLDVTVSDNCPVIVTANLSGATFATGLITLNGVTFNEGATTVTWTATDGFNTITHAFVVKVKDNEFPVISGMPLDITVNTAPNNCGQTVFWTPPTNSDNCGSTMTSNYNSGAFFPVGVTYVVYTATDLSGNVTEDSFKIEVIDNQKPKIQNVPANITVFNDAGFCGANVTWLPPTVSDNCPGVTTSATHLPGSYFPVGTTTVTYTATAANGDTTVKSFTVTVNDNEKPNVSVLNPTVYLDAFGNATISVSTVEASSSDNCGIASKTINVNTFDCTNVGPNPVILTVTDIYGNVANQTATVTVKDTVKPVVQTQNITIQLDAFGNATITPAQINNGSTDACGIASLALDKTTFNCSNVGVNTVTLTVTDVNGNSDSKTATVTVQDVTKPNVVTQNITVFLDGAGNATITPAQINNGSTDACGIASLVLNKTTFNCSNVGPNTVTLTVTDVNGNSDSKTATVTVQDVTKPNVITQNITVQLDAAGNVTITPAQVNNGSSDNCNIASITLDKTTFNCSNVGPNTVTLTVTDVNGNSDSKTATVTVQDVTKPNVVTQNITVFLDGAGNATITPAQINNGSTDACGIASLALDKTTFNCSNVGPNTVTLTVTDVNGNSDSKTATVIVVDNLPPIVQTKNITVQLDAFGNASITPASVDNGTFDACMPVTLSLSKSTFNCSDIGPNTVTLIATDPSGNSASGTATVTVEDKIAPVALCQNVTVTLDGSGNASVTAAAVNNGSTDNCTAPGLLQLSLSKTNFNCSDVGPNTVTLSVTDAQGNTGTCSAIVTVVDNTTPIITFATPNQNVTNDPGQCGAIVNYPATTATDNCPVTITYSQNSGTFFPVGVTTVTVTVKDGAGNTATHTFTVTVKDNQVPKFSNAPTNITLDNLNNNCAQHAYWAPPVITDNCALNTVKVTRDGKTVVTVPAAQISVLNAVLIGEMFPVGNTRITYIADDTYGNVDSVFFNIKVNDTQKPQIKGIPANLNLSMDKGFCYATGTWAEPTATDNCPGVVLTTTHKPGFQFPLGTTTVTYTATDAAGNTDVQSFTVTVNDTEFPVFSCPANIVVSNDNKQCDAVVNYTVTATDNCPSGLGVTQLTGLPSGAKFPIGVTTVSYSATDSVGNTSICSFTVTVKDTEKPVFTSCPLDIEGDAIVNDPGKITRTVNYTVPTATDNCPGSTVTLVQGLPSGAAFPLGKTRVVYVATDAAGNSDSCIFNVRVNYRNEQPNFIANNPPTVLEDAGRVVVSNWATFQPTTILPTNSIEAAQKPLRYVVSNISNPALFVSMPEVDLSGTLRYELTPNANGSSTFSVFVQDDGGKDFGGVDVSATQTFTITVTPVNDAPTMDALPDIAVNGTALTQIDLTGITTGADNEIQNITITATSSAPAIIPNPTISYTSPNATGVLTFQSNLNQTGPVTIRVRVADDGGTANGGVDTLIRSFDVLVKVSEEIYLPTLFSPNNDKANDRFIVRGNGIQELDFKIFDREGNLVYETTDVMKALTEGWDGKIGGQDAPQGFYMWTLTGVMVNDGALKVRSFINNKGEVQLIR